MTNLNANRDYVAIQCEIQTTPTRPGVPVREHLYYAVDGDNQPVLVLSSAHLHATRIIPRADLQAEFGRSAGATITYRYAVGDRVPVFGR